jgi:catechol 2,3-dioxygenase-like lactoylglutathione lyase family enzyme
MFDHVTIRVSDREASERFYDTVLPIIGLSLSHSDEHHTAWAELFVGQASEEKAVTRRLHVGLVATSRELVDEFWLAGTAAGYRDDGAPGPRPQYREDYYGAFLLDPDGNSVEAVHHSLVPRRTSVVDHLWLRVADLAAARRFYETIAPVAGFRVAGEREDRVGFGGPGGSFTITEGEPTENAHLAFPVAARAAVEELHRLATEAGCRDDGAYVLDPDGNTIEAVFSEAP